MIPLDDQRNFICGELDKLGAALGIGSLGCYAAELESDPTLKSDVEEKVADEDFFRTKHWDSVLRFGLYRFTQYALARRIKPAGIIETGVLHGLSTTFSLAALVRNTREGDVGRMISIDYPSTAEGGAVNHDGFTDTLPPARNPGWAIPDRLRDPWRLRIGPSSSELQPVVDELGDPGIFVHDSEHTVRTMTYEFQTVWPALCDGGVLLADNIDVNTAFFEFAQRVERIPHVLPVDPDHAVPGASGIRCGLLRK